MNKLKTKLLCLSLPILLTLSGCLGCNAIHNLNEASNLKEITVTVDSADTLASSISTESEYINRNTLVVDYVYYSESNENPHYEIPETFTRNGRVYHFTGDVKYSVSEPMKGIAVYQESEVEEQEEAAGTFLYTSPETGITYSLPKAHIRFSEKMPITKTLTSVVHLGPQLSQPEIPENREIIYMDKEENLEKSVLGNLSSTSSSDFYWLKADEPIQGTFYTDKYDLNCWVIGWEVDEEKTTPEHTEYKPIKIGLDFCNSTYPSWEGYEEDIIKWLNLNPEMYRITGADWAGEIYEKQEYQKDWDREITVAYRDASYPYEVLVKNYDLTYEADIETLGYQVKAWYFSSEKEIRNNQEIKGRKLTERDFEKALKEDIKIFYQITASATYVCDEPLKSLPAPSPDICPGEEMNTHKEPGTSKESNNQTLSLEEIQRQQFRVEALRKINPDVCGVIQIKDTVLDHPLMQCMEEEDFYLRRDLWGAPSIKGVPFLSLESTLDCSGSNSIIYGHNIHRTGHDVFADLALYENLDFYKEHPLIDLFTSPSGANQVQHSQYIVFAYYLIDTSDTQNRFDYWSTTRFNTPEEFDCYMKEVSRRNWLKTPLDLSYEDSYITLSSCSLELEGSKTNRMVVMARKIRETDNLTMTLWLTEKNETPLLPLKLRSPESGKAEKSHSKIVCQNNPLKPVMDSL